MTDIASRATEEICNHVDDIIAMGSLSESKRQEFRQIIQSAIDEATLDANKKTMQTISLTIDLADENKELLTKNAAMREFIYTGWLELRSWESMRWHYENNEDSNPTPEELAECRKMCKELNKKRLELIKQK